MISERWNEEIELMKIEMERFLSYYSKHILPQLLDQISKINEEIDHSVVGTENASFFIQKSVK